MQLPEPIPFQYLFLRQQDVVWKETNAKLVFVRPLEVQIWETCPMHAKVPPETPCYCWQTTRPLTKSSFMTSIPFSKSLAKSFGPLKSRFSNGRYHHSGTWQDTKACIRRQRERALEMQDARAEPVKIALYQTCDKTGMETKRTKLMTS